MSAAEHIEPQYFQQFPPSLYGHRYLNRRSFLKASAAAIGATAAVVATHRFPSTRAFAEETADNKENNSKGVSSRSLRLARCPVTGDRVSMEASIDYRGGTLYFCSAECIDKFRADRTAYEAKANMQLVATGQYEQIKCPLTGDAFVPRIKTKVSGVDVCFSSTDALKKVKRASADERTELVFGEGFDKGFAMKQDGNSASAPTSNKWSCVVCGYVHSGSTPPAKCPKCGAKSDSFMPVAAD